jgi:mannan endo-1,4-beta-mannosidase
LDCYCFALEADTTQIANYAAQLDKNLGMACAIAKKHQKAVALTETGYEGIKTANWWTHTLAPILSRHPISYVLLWRNAREKPGHFFAPYPGHASVPDFVRFYNAPQTLFLRDVNGLYLSK